MHMERGVIGIACAMAVASLTCGQAEARQFSQKNFYWLDGRLPRTDERLVVSMVSHLDDVAGPCDPGSTQINQARSQQFGQKVFAVECGAHGYEVWHIFGYGWFWTAGGRLTYTR